jgi:hypothetical protein
LLEKEDPESFAAALRSAAELDGEARERLAEAARRTARELSLAKCTQHVLETYQAAIDRRSCLRKEAPGSWPSPLKFLRYQWRAWSRLLEVAGQSLAGTKKGETVEE